MATPPTLSNPNVGGGAQYAGVPYTYSVDVYDEDRAAGVVNDYVSEAILRMWRKVQGSWRYIGAKRKLFTPIWGTTPQSAAVDVYYEPAETNPYAWLAFASDGQFVNQPNNGSVVTQWMDRSGNGRYASRVNSSLKPTVISGGLILNDTASFTGGRAIKIPGALPQPITMAFVVKVGATGAVRAIWHGTTASMYLATDNRLILYSNLGVGIATTALSVGWHIVVLVLNGASSKIRVDGASAATGNDGTAGISSAGLFIGTNPSAGEPLTGELAMFIMWNRVVTDPEIEKIEEYAALRAGMTTSLPAAHRGNSAHITELPYFDDPWTPQDFTLGLRNAWWSGETITGANGAAIPLWADAAGATYNDATAVIGQYPTVKTPGSGNGIPSAEFDGANDFFSTPLSASNVSETIFAVIKPDVVTGTRAILGAAATGGRTFKINAGKLQVSKTGTADYNTGSTALVTAGQVTLVSVAIEPTTTTYGINGTLGAAIAHAQAPTASIASQIGRSSAGEFFDGEIMALISTRSLTTSARQLLEGYLAWTFGIQVNLPTDHPYRYTKPNFTGSGEREIAWTMEVRDALGGISGTAIFGRDDETLGPDETTAFSTSAGGYLSGSLPDRLMSLWPRGQIQVTYSHEYGVSAGSIQARLLQSDDAGNYGVVAESVTLYGTWVASTIFYLTWVQLDLPPLSWNADYALEWRTTDVYGHQTDWLGRSYFSTDKTPYRPSSLSPESGTVTTGYPLLTFSVQDDDDAPGASFDRYAPYAYVAKSGTSGTLADQFQNPLSIAEDSAGNIFVLDSVKRDIQKYNASLVYQTRYAAASGAAAGQFGASVTGLGVNTLTNDIFVAEFGNARVQKFNSAFTFQVLLNLTPAPNGIIVNKGDVWIPGGKKVTKATAALAVVTSKIYPVEAIYSGAYYERGNILFVVSGNPNTIMALDGTTLEVLYTFGEAGMGPGQIWQTSSSILTVNESDGILYHLNQSSRVITRWTIDGQYISSYMFPLGSANDQMTNPRSIFASRVDSTRLFFVDSNLDRVQRFDEKSNATIIADSHLAAEVEVAFPDPVQGTYDASTITLANSGAWVITPSWEGVYYHTAPGATKLSITTAPAANPTTLAFVYALGNKWFDVVEGGEYSFSAWISNQYTEFDFSLVIFWRDALNNVIGSTALGDVGLDLVLTGRGSRPIRLYGPGLYDQLGMSAIAPPGAVGALCNITISRNATAAFSGPKVIYIDDVIFGGDARFLRQATSIGGGAFSYQMTSADMPANGTYKIRARGKDVLQTGSWSDQQIIQKVTGPVVTIDSPTPGSTISTATPLVQWSLVSGAQWAYKIEIYTVAGDVAYNSGWVQSTTDRSFSVPPGYLEDGVSYFLRMYLDDGTMKVLV